MNTAILYIILFLLFLIFLSVIKLISEIIAVREMLIEDLKQEYELKNKKS